jgi:hypothetical protein
MKMPTLTEATFQFVDPTVLVTFREDVVVITTETTNGAINVETVPNTPRRWGGRPYKPCVSHALDCIRLAQGKPAKTEQEKYRRKMARPKLEVHRP